MSLSPEDESVIMTPEEEEVWLGKYFSGRAGAGEDEEEETCMSIDQQMDNLEKEFEETMRMASTGAGATTATPATPAAKHPSVVQGSAAPSPAAATVGKPPAVAAKPAAATAPAPGKSDGGAAAPAPGKPGGGAAAPAPGKPAAAAAAPADTRPGGGAAAPAPGKPAAVSRPAEAGQSHEHASSGSPDEVHQGPDGDEEQPYGASADNEEGTNDADNSASADNEEGQQDAGHSASAGNEGEEEQLDGTPTENEEGQQDAGNGASEGNEGEEEKLDEVHGDDSMHDEEDNEQMGEGDDVSSTQDRVEETDEEPVEKSMDAECCVRRVYSELHTQADPDVVAKLRLAMEGIPEGAKGLEDCRTYFSSKQHYTLQDVLVAQYVLNDGLLMRQGQGTDDEYHVDIAEPLV